MIAKHTTLTLALVCLVGVPSTLAQGAKSNMVSSTATIQAIDNESRKITLRNEKGEDDVYTAGPELQRFNELKVGDKVKMTYYESVVFAVRKPGDPATPSSVEMATERAKVGLPAGAAIVQRIQTVTVKAIDPVASSVTVATQDGREVSRKIQDKSKLDNVKVGDQVDITYTEALLVGVERAE